MKNLYHSYIILVVALGISTLGYSQCEPWCQGTGNTYMLYNAYPHSLWWHRHQKQRVYKIPSIGRYYTQNNANNIVPLQTPPNINSPIQYYYGNGNFYINYNGGYIVVAAPIGYTVPTIPPGSNHIKYNDTVYCYYGGNFYVENANSYYTTVKAPLGISIPELPPNAVALEDGRGNIVYRYGNTFYLPRNIYGNIWYQVIEN